MRKIIRHQTDLYLRNTRHYAQRFAKQLPRRWYLEVGAVLFGIIFILVATTLLTPYRQSARFTAGNTQESTVNYYRAEVLHVNPTSLDVAYLDGPQRSETDTVEFSNAVIQQTAKVGETILVAHGGNDSRLFYVDRYRLPGLVVLMAVFAALVLLVGRRRGFASLIGLTLSIAIIGWFIIPLIAAGHNALLVTITGAYIIAFSSTVIAHGWKTRTFISVGCIALVLAIVAILSQIVVNAFQLLGVTTEDVLFLSMGNHNLDMSAILTGGIIIASLGVLDDIVTAQVATVDEILKANNSFGVAALYRRASSVGGEHIAALVNTLVLVYVGAALPSVVAMWAVGSNALVQLNGEYLATEIVRTVVTSIGLVLSVPVSTLGAAWVLRRQYERTLTTSKR